MDMRFYAPYLLSELQVFSEDRVFEKILKDHSPDRVAEWMAHYESDTEVT
jgi:hypothetical protein